eukprot:9115515-Prorocentrum_lima.AAC.1
MAMPIPLRPWISVTMDFICGLPMSDGGNDRILVVMDRLSRMCHLIPCNTHLTAVQCVDLFMKEIYRLHGMPRVIITDQDPLWLSGFWKSFFDILDTKLAFGVAYRCASTGAVERMNRIVRECQKHYCTHDNKDWDKKIPFIEFAINNSPLAPHQMSPF